MKHRALLAASMFCAVPPSAHAADWTMDAAASRLEFFATFERTAAPGGFKQFETELRFDPEQPAQASLEVTIAVNSADMNSADVNQAIRDAPWFDVARFPQARFRSTDIRRIDASRFLARGTLNLKGVQQRIEVPFAWSQSATAARMQGELVVKRSEFGIGTGEWAATNVIGAEVKIRFDVRLRRKE